MPENADVLSHFPLIFLSTSKQDASLYCIAHDYSCTDWDNLHDYFRDAPWKNIF